MIEDFAVDVWSLANARKALQETANVQKISFLLTVPHDPLGTEDGRSNY
jgi:hypothetical protein